MHLPLHIPTAFIMTMVSFYRLSETSLWNRTLATIHQICFSLSWPWACFILKCSLHRVWVLCFSVFERSLSLVISCHCFLFCFLISPLILLSPFSWRQRMQKSLSSCISKHALILPYMTDNWIDMGH